MVRQFSSTAVATTLTAGINGAVTSMAVAATTGFPASTPYTLVLDPDNVSKELVEVTAVVGLTLTITRGVDGTSGVAHTLGAVVRHDHSARDFREPQQHIAATSDVHGVTGAIIGATQAQALTNKDLTSGTNTFPPSLVTQTGVQTLTNKDLSSGTNTFPAALATDVEVAAAVSAHAAVTTGVHGAGAGSVVGTTLSQTLTNKSLTSPVITGTGSANFTTLTVGGVSVIPTQMDLVEITANATFTKATYPYGKYLMVDGCAPGGGGGAALATGVGEASAGTGGGKGEFSRVLIPFSSLAASETITCPAGGAGGISGLNAGAGADAANASFGAFLVLAGGQGGNAMSAGTGSSGATGGSFGGGAAFRSGGAAMSGAGGSSIYGAGGLGRGSGTPSAGSAGGAGAGGGGAVNGASQAARIGGAGGAAKFWLTVIG